MRNEYDFSKAKRGPAVSQRGKTRVTLWLDNEVIEAFRSQAEAAGKGYQTLINEALREHIGASPKPLDEEALRRVLREELKHAG
ncbi:BrnA antitoxin family protein [Arhodomonas sp. AD133]|uniref:BrnA antitoxin family protein n=1 Tax=Arhodomonas sp. AD133 TaxID=3415009 RepID=UPI003EC15674